MASIRRRGGNLVAAFDADEAALLRRLVGDLLELVAEPGAADADPLEALTGLSDAPREAPTDPAVARLFPDGYRDDPEAAAELRRLTEPSLRESKSTAASAVLDTLPENGGRIRLGEENATAWLAALNDLRLVLGTRLDVTEETAPLGGHRPDDPEAAPYVIYHWLTALQDDLVTALAD